MFWVVGARKVQIDSKHMRIAIGDRVCIYIYVSLVGRPRGGGGRRARPRPMAARPLYCTATAAQATSIGMPTEAMLLPPGIASALITSLVVMITPGTRARSRRGVPSLPSLRAHSSFGSLPVVFEPRPGLSGRSLRDVAVRGGHRRVAVVTRGLGRGTRLAQRSGRLLAT